MAASVDSSATHGNGRYSGCNTVGWRVVQLFYQVNTGGFLLLPEKGWSEKLVTDKQHLKLRCTCYVYCIYQEGQHDSTNRKLGIRTGIVQTDSDWSESEQSKLGRGKWKLESGKSQKLAAIQFNKRIGKHLKWLVRYRTLKVLQTDGEFKSWEKSSVKCSH